MATNAQPADAIPATPTADQQWFALEGDAVAAELGVDVRAGLSPAEAETRLERYGTNAFAVTRAEPRWNAFLRQYRDPMQIVLLSPASAASGRCKSSAPASSSSS